MSVVDQINQVASNLSEPKLGELLDFARFVQMQVERNEWRAAGQLQFAKAYGPSEPEYTDFDIGPS